MRKKKVAILFGGRSTEHEISVITALQLMEAVDPYKIEAIPIYITQKGKWLTGEALFEKARYSNLDLLIETSDEVTCLPTPGKGFVFLKDLKKIPVDAAILAFHGTYGEDGAIQGLLELADIPYTSCSVAASAIAMDKALCKAALSGVGIPVLPWLTVKWGKFAHTLDQVLKDVAKTFGENPYPLFVKPCTLGSSIGLFRAEDEEGLIRALSGVFKYERKALIEPMIENLMEINISLYAYRGVYCSPLEIPLPEKDILTFEDKYKRSGGKGSSLDTEGMAGLTRVINPKNLPKEIEESVRAFAKKAFEVIDCKGVVRFDFMYDKKREKLYFNELNTIPGSMAYYLWEKASPPLYYPDLIEQLVEEAILQKVEKESVKEELPFTIIS